jgi:hypothetical protein
MAGLPEPFRADIGARDAGPAARFEARALRHEQSGLAGGMTARMRDTLGKVYLRQAGAAADEAGLDEAIAGGKRMIAANPALKPSQIAAEWRGFDAAARRAWFDAQPPDRRAALLDAASRGEGLAAGFDQPTRTLLAQQADRDLTAAEVKAHAQGIAANTALSREIEGKIEAGTFGEGDLAAAARDQFKDDPAEVARLDGLIRARDRKAKDTAFALAVFRDPAVRFNPQDPQDRARANLAYGALGGPKGLLEGADDAAGILDKVIARTGVLPDDAAEELRRGARSEDPAVMARAYALIARLKERSPAAMRGDPGLALAELEERFRYLGSYLELTGDEAAAEQARLNKTERMVRLAEMTRGAQASGEAPEASGQQRPAGSLTAYHPTLRDRLGETLTAGARQGSAWGNTVYRLVGSNGLEGGDPGLSLIDFTPFGSVLAADEGIRAARDGNYGKASLDAAGAAAPVAGAAAKVGRPVLEAAAVKARPIIDGVKRLFGFGAEEAGAVERAAHPNIGAGEAVTPAAAQPPVKTEAPNVAVPEEGKKPASATTVSPNPSSGQMTAAGRSLVPETDTNRPGGQLRPIDPKFSVQNLQEMTRLPDKNGLTRAGRALWKHGQGGNGQPGRNSFPSVKGHANHNEMGDKIVSDILNDPQSWWTPNRIGGWDIKAPNGRGLRFYSDGRLHSFREP